MTNRVVTWVNSVPEMREWAESIDKPATRKAYQGVLYLYWNSFLKLNHASVKAWLERIRREQRSSEPNVRNHWALECKHYYNNFVSPKTGRKMGYSMKQILTAALLSIIRARVDEGTSYNFKLEPTDEELLSTQRQAMSPKEVIALYNACHTPRDKAIILTMVNGIAPNEFCQIASRWEKWFKPDIKAPLHIEVVRTKKKFPYHVTLFEDAVDSIKELYNQRLHETGDLTGKPLFEYNGRTPTPVDIDTIFEDLRERAKLKEPVEKYKSQRVRAHGFRHFLKTQGRLFGADSGVVEFAMGHKGDKYGYDKSSLEPQWVEVVDRELGKMKPVLNIVTGRAQAILKDKEEELRAKAAKDTYKMLVESGVLKPENLTKDVLELIAKKIGVAFEKLVMMADVDELSLPNEVQTRLGLFDLIAGSIDISDEIYHKYYNAIKATKPVNASLRWENHTHFYLRCQVGSEEYLQALTQGWEIFDKGEGDMRILRLAKPSSS